MTEITHWLTRLPEFLSFAIVLAVLVSAVCVAPRLLRRPVSRLRIEAQAGSVIDAYKAVIGFLGLVLAFSLVQAQTNYRASEELVVREANAIGNVDRSLARFGDPRMSGLRPPLLEYAKAVVGEEWRVMSSGGRSARADALYVQVSRPARAVDVVDPRQQAIFNEILRGLDDVADFRESRLNAASVGLPGLFWDVVTALFILLVILSALVAPTLDRALMMGGMVAGLGLVLALVIIVDLPFEGDVAVQPRALNRVIQTMANRI